LARVQEAQLMLGFALERGDGTAKSPSEAVEW
jgi:TPR repeat protein